MFIFKSLHFLNVSITDWCTDMIMSAYRQRAGRIPIISKYRQSPSIPSRLLYILRSKDAIVVPVERWLPPFNFPVSYHAVSLTIRSMGRKEAKKGDGKRSRHAKTAISPQNLSLSLSSTELFIENILRGTWLWSGPDLGLCGPLGASPCGLSVHMAMLREHCICRAYVCEYARGSLTEQSALLI